MASQFEIYRCDLCGNIVEIAQGGCGVLVCCGEPMALLQENTVDAAAEKHVPLIEKAEGFIKVTVGSVNHPMEDVHYIQWIELLADGKRYTHYLQPGDAPEAIFPITADQVTARQYCNLHGHWAARI